MKYISALTIADNVRQSLLNTMNVNRMKDSPFLEVPPIEAVYQNEQINLTVGKLAGMYELDKITQDVNSSLRAFISALRLYLLQYQLMALTLILFLKMF